MFRELTRKKQQLSSDECIALLKQELRGVLSVLGDNGYPYGLPINHWYNEEDGCLYFHSGKQGHKVDAMRNCPKASFCVYDKGTGTDTWALDIQSVIVFGTLEEITDQAKAIAMVRKLSEHFVDDRDYIQYEIEKSGHRTLCFRLVPEHMTGKKVHEA